MTRTEVIYGTNPVIEAIRAGRRRIHEVYIAVGRREKDVLFVEDVACQHNVVVKRLSKDEIGRLTHTEKHQGIAARCDCYIYAAVDEVLDNALKDGRGGFLLILDGITDPHNLGSLIRTSHLMGVQGVILPRDNAAPITPTVVKSSAGAIEHQRIACVSNLARTIIYIKKKGFWTFVADGESKDVLYLHDFKGYNIAVVLGAEGRGVRRLIRKECDFGFSIPMKGVVMSYNVAVAGALFMGEIARQRWMFEHAKTIPKGP